MDRVIDLYEDELFQLLDALKNAGGDTRLYNKINNQLTPETDMKSHIKWYHREIRKNGGIRKKPTKNDIRLYRYKLEEYEGVINMTYDNGMCGTNTRFILDMIRYINIDYLPHIYSIGYDEYDLNIELYNTIGKLPPWNPSKYYPSVDNLINILNTIIQSEYIKINVSLIEHNE